MTRTACALIVVVLFAFVAPASAFELGVKGAYWVPKFSGKVRLDSGNTRGSLVNFSDDLGIDDENFLFGEAWLWLGRHHITVAGMQIDYSGSETIAQEIVFGGTTFDAAGTIDSSLEYTMLDFAYQYDLLDLENILAGFSLGPIVQLKYLDGDVEMKGLGTVEGVTAQRQESESFQIPIPLVGVGVHVGVLADYVEVRARGVGITYSGNSLYELQGEVTFSPFPFVEIMGGYRHFVIDVDEDDVLLDYQQTGPYVGASVKI